MKRSDKIRLIAYPIVTVVVLLLTIREPTALMKSLALFNLITDYMFFYRIGLECQSETKK